MPPARRPKGATPTNDNTSGLIPLGLPPGTAIRFRRRETERWKNATVVCLEADGSLGVSDDKGAHRSVPLETVEVKERGARGGVVWVPARNVAERIEQLRLL